MRYYKYKLILAIIIRMNKILKIITSPMSLNLRLIYRLSSQNNHNSSNNTFGFREVSTDQKQPLVNEVFHSVANKYDLMNDLMSAGIHRYWKTLMISEMGLLTPNIHTHEPPKKVHVLDVAGGTFPLTQAQVTSLSKS